MRTTEENNLKPRDRSSVAGIKIPQGLISRGCNPPMIASHPSYSKSPMIPSHPWLAYKFPHDCISSESLQVAQLVEGRLTPPPRPAAPATVLPGPSQSLFPPGKELPGRRGSRCRAAGPPAAFRNGTPAAFRAGSRAQGGPRGKGSRWGGGGLQVLVCGRPGAAARPGPGPHEPARPGPAQHPNG